MNRLTYSHTRSLEVWKRCAPYLCTSMPVSGLGLAVGVAAEVVAALEDEDLQAQLVRTAFGDRQAEEAGSDDDEVSVQHTLLVGEAAVSLSGGVGAPAVCATPSRRWAR